MIAGKHRVDAEEKVRVSTETIHSQVNAVGKRGQTWQRHLRNVPWRSKTMLRDGSDEDDRKHERWTSAAVGEMEVQHSK